MSGTVRAAGADGVPAVSIPLAQINAGGAAEAFTTLALIVGLVVLVLLLLVIRRRRREMWTSEADHYRLIAESSGDVFFELSAESDRLTWSSDLGEQLLGYDKEELDPQTRNFDDWVHAADVQPLRRLWERLLGGDKIDLDLRLRTAEGKGLWVHLFAVPVKDEDESSSRAIGVVRTTQDLHDIQAELAEARRVQSVGTMASGIAHEFNNHLTPIRGFIELALDSLGHHPVSEGLKTALNRVEYCTELVAQIQAYGRKSLLLPEPVELPRLLPSVVRIAMSSYRARSHKVTLEEQYPPALPELWVDQAQLQQAVVQLIRNALEAMPTGGQLTIRAESVFVDKSHAEGGRDIRPGNFICISVVDTGTGISPENLEQIFDPFFTTHKRADKRGMGLPMVQGMVAQHGGWLEIKSDVGVGTEVRMYLPQQQREEKKEEPVPAPVDADGTMAVLPAAPLGRMLIGDDEDLIRSLIRKVFEAEGWMVDEAANFDEVVERSRGGEEAYDLMVLDLTMNGPTAEEVVDRILAKQPDTRILIISGFGRDERVDNLVGRTGGQFVGKPFSPKELLSKVDELVAQG